MRHRREVPKIPLVMALVGGVIATILMYYAGGHAGAKGTVPAVEATVMGR